MAADSLPDVPTVPAPFEELGTGGVRKSGGYILADYNPLLNGRNAARAYQEMANNDELIHGILYAQEMSARQVPWWLEPFDESPRAKEEAEILKGELFEECETPWPEVIAEMCSKFTFGYAPMEYTLCPRGAVSGPAVTRRSRVGVKKIALRAQETIDRWVWDPETDELLGLYQLDEWGGRKEVFLPIEKLLLTRTTAMRGNPEGRSLLRGAYRTYVAKRALEEAVAMKAVRTAGVVIADVPRSIMSTTASEPDKALRASILRIVKDLSTNGTGYAVLPSDVHPETKQRQIDVRFLTVDAGGIGDIEKVITRKDNRMAASLLADFILLGQQAVGSFALADTKTALFAVALHGFLDIDAAVTNRKLIRMLYALNGWNVHERATLMHGSVEEPALEAMANGIATLIQAGVFRPTGKLRERMAQLFKVPQPKDGEFESDAEGEQPESGGDPAMAGAAAGQGGGRGQPPATPAEDPELDAED